MKLIAAGLELKTFFDNSFFQCISSSANILQLDPFSLAGTSSILIGSKDNASEEFAHFKWTRTNEDSFDFEVTVDLWNSRPVYYIKSTSGLYSISTDPLSCAIFCTVSRINIATLIETLLFDHQLGKETLIENVNRLEGGDKLMLRHLKNHKSNLVIKSGILPQYQTRGTNFNLHAKNTCESLMAACEGLTDKSPDSLVQISGGLDSRLLLACLAKTNSKAIKTGTVPFNSEREVEIGAQVSKQVNAHHLRFELERINEKTLHDAFLLTGGQASLLGAIGNFPMYNYFDSKQGGLLIGGWTGDALIGSYPPNSSIYLSPKESLIRRSLRNYVAYRSFFSKKILQVFKSKPKSEIEFLIDSAKHRFFVSLLDSSGNTAAQKISYWSMFVRQGHFSHISPSKLLPHFLEKSPMLNANYINHLLQLTPTEIINKNFYRNMIATHFPRLSQIPTDSKPFVSPIPILPKFLRSKSDAQWYLPKVVIDHVINRKSLNATFMSNEVKAFSENFLRRSGTKTINSFELTLDSLNIDSRDFYLIEHLQRIYSLHSYLQELGN